MSLRDEILAGGFDLESRDCQAIADALSVNRIKTVKTEIGKGMVLATIGLEAGNALLDIIDNEANLRHVKQLVANGWLDVGDALTRAMIDQICSPASASALKALAEVPDKVTAQQVAEVIYNPDGSII